MKILLVDDELPTRNAVSRLLIEKGYDVDTVSSGEEAINYAHNNYIDVLLTDFRMPGGLDGLTTARAIRLIQPQIIIIMVTGHSSLDLVVCSLNLGVHGFLIKPFTAFELTDTIEQTIAQQFLFRSFISYDFYNYIDLITSEAEKSILAVTIQNGVFRSESLIDKGAVSIPYFEIIKRLGPNDLLAIVPTQRLDEIIDKFVTYFHRFIEDEEEQALLAFGYAQGGINTSATDYLEAVAQDLVDRYTSQYGTVLPDQPAILMLEPGRLALQLQYESFLKMQQLNQNTIDAHQDICSIQTRITQLTAIMHHDLNSGFSLLIQTTEDLSKKITDSTLALDIKWIKKQFTLCSAYQRSILELGNDTLIQLHSTNLNSWIKEKISLLVEQLQLSLAIEIVELADLLLVNLDRQSLLSACLQLLLSISQAKAHKLKITFDKAQFNENLVLTFEDDGLCGERLKMLDMSITEALYTNTGAKIPLSFSLLRHTLKQQNIILQCRQNATYFQMSWQFPSSLNKTSITPKIKSLEMLRQETNLLQQELVKFEATTNNLEVKALNKSILYRADSLLLLNLQEFELHLQRLVSRTEALVGEDDKYKDLVSRIKRLSLYCYLIERNLLLALSGDKLPVESVNVNEQLNIVIDLLEHKLSHLKVSFDLDPNVLPISIASVEIKQVFMNLIKNAAEATKPGGSLVIRTKFNTIKKTIEIEIQDTGTGILPEYTKKIFELHFSTKGKKNSGVGLYAVKSIVTKAKGSIKVSSVVTEGSSKRIQRKALKTISKLLKVPDKNPGTTFRLVFPVAK